MTDHTLGPFLSNGEAGGDNRWTTPRKTWPEWTLEERRTAIAEINMARNIFNNASAVWMWCNLGLPIPPRHLLPAWWQSDLTLNPT